ncbi:GGDEF domain-containing protein [Methylophaga sp. OBS3]|uniref:GGDEF domain-containing protein n=1 Tax=Methylophaga sp. OBS3 TaxID=2991934 RepID=UPI0022525D17|nr:GGDEF domain-containing protein [Methylophaga sp. OBS3]MCX4190468.1 GGDEF domain-containing protein [Methylophaga sp. OBS3]
MANNSSFPPVYGDAFQQASENLRRTLPLVNRYKTPITPVNYAVWYEYVSGNNQALINAIDTRLNKGDEITQELTQYLYEKYVLMGMPERLEQTNNGLRLVVDNTISNINRAEITAGDLASDLNQSHSLLENCQDIDDIKNVLSGILENTRKLSESSSGLKQELAESTQEILKLRSELEAVKQEARLDSLTGLLNRNSFSKEIAQLCRTGQVKFALMVFDIDNFKQVNDRFGHALGDKLLQFFGTTLQKRCDDLHIAARLGGDEFCMLLLHSNPHEAHTIAEAIRSSLEESRLKKKDSHESIGEVTVSIGISMFTPGDTPSSLFERSDKALYTAKQNGRNQIFIDV